MPGAVAGRDQTYYDGTKPATRTFSGVLPESGTYTINVYLDNTAAARRTVAPFRLRVTIPPAIKQPVPTTPSTPPTSDGDGWFTANFSAVMYVRSGPRTGYRSVGTVYSGLPAKNLGCSGAGSAQWCKVSVHQRGGDWITGWMKGVYLKKPGVPQSPDPGTPGADHVKYRQVYNVSTAVNVRSEPGTSYARVGKVSRYSIVNNLGCGNGWCKISSLAGTGTTVTGWVSAAYLREYTAG